ncbi:hypothetical protein [Subtercola endophyticus]|uniref:hypothetical protein n=1 Tax=Subtercola endophyticus TaxID=2895559 RepID=UPI001E3FC2AF|nr:hypothetical protein [Subtercola endophyticus]UFS59301.1 hypothetical protein LQ955_00410 [Subtercola endophyticus]
MSDERTTGDPNAPQYDPAPTSETVAEHEGAEQESAAQGSAAQQGSEQQSAEQQAAAGPAVDFGAPAEQAVDAPAVVDPQTAVAPSELAPVDTAAPGEGAAVDAETAAPAAELPPAAPIAEPLTPASAVYDVPETPQPTPTWAAPAAEAAAVAPTVAEPASAPIVAAITPAELGAPASEAVAYPAAAFQTPTPYTEPAAPAGDAAPGVVAGAVLAAPGAAAVAAPAAYPPGTYPPAGYQQAPGAPGYQGYGAPAAVVVPVLTPPKKRGNRGIGILISLVGTVIYAVLFAVVAAVILAFNVPASRLGGVVGDFVSSPAYYVPVIFFAIALILVVLIVNRAGWWAYVLGGFLVAVVVYGAAILGALLAVQAWNFSSADLTTFIRSLVMDPLTLAAAIVAREVPIWIGAWIASRGRKLKAKNAADREEYERKLAETPVATYPAAPAAPAI